MCEKHDADLREMRKEERGTGDEDEMWATVRTLRALSGSLWGV